MNLIYHRSVQSDVSAVLGYYDEVGGPGLGEAFLDEFMTHVAWALENPTRFHPVEGDLDGPIFNASLTISSIESMAIRCGFSSSDTTTAILLTV
jgi:hypothetical protein